MKPIAVFGFITILSSSCNSPKSMESTDLSGSARWLISDLKQPCVGVGPMDCLVYRNAETGAWSYLYSEISGFEYDPNYAVEIEVRSEKIENPPADGSSIRYVMVREIARHPVYKLDGVINDSWGVVELNGRPVDRGANIFFEINQRTGKMLGRGGCNDFSADIRLYDSHIKGIRISNRVNTEMDCDRLEWEQEFFTALETADRIAFDRAEVSLLNGEEVLLRGRRID